MSVDPIDAAWGFLKSTLLSKGLGLEAGGEAYKDFLRSTIIPLLEEQDMGGEYGTDEELEMWRKQDYNYIADARKLMEEGTLGDTYATEEDEEEEGPPDLFGSDKRVAVTKPGQTMAGSAELWASFSPGAGQWFGVDTGQWAGTREGGLIAGYKAVPEDEHYLP